MNKTFDDICGLEYDKLMEKEIISILGFDASADKPYMISNKLLNIEHDKFYKTSIFFSEKETTVTLVFSEDSEEDCCFFEKKKEITKKTNYVYNLFCDIKSIDTNSYFSIDNKEYNFNKVKSINANNQKVFYCFNDDEKPNILNINYLHTIAAIHLNKGVLLKIDDYLFLEKCANSLISALNIKKMRNSNPLFELLFFNNENELTKESKELVELNYGY